MKTIRRLYFYAITLISFELVLWGLIGLIRTAISGDISPGIDTLAQTLALILVGVPVFLFHWLWIQRTVAKDEEEYTAALRAVFLYGILLATLIPAVQNTLALINRLLLESSGVSPLRALFGGTQAWTDNLIAIFFNLVAAFYFYRILQSDWQKVPDKENLVTISRIYKYIWLIYSLLMVIFGSQQIIRFIFIIPSSMLGSLQRDTFINGLALLVVGTPIWVVSWRQCQQALDDPAERGSILRLAVLYLLALAGVASVLTTAGMLLDIILSAMLGDISGGYKAFFRAIGSPISVLIPMAMVWAYYGHWLALDIQAVEDSPRRAGMKRFYYYLLSLAGLVAAFTGLSLLLSVVIDLITAKELWGAAMTSRLAAALSTLAVGLPLWLVTWRAMQAEAFAPGDEGDHARRSLIRRSYLYIIIFGSVIGIMASAVAFAYQALVALFGSPDIGFWSSGLNAIQLLLLFSGLLAYHLVCLRNDNARASDTLSVRHSKFGVMVFDPDGGAFANAVALAIQKHTPGMPVAIQSISQPIPDEARGVQAVVLPAGMALSPPEAVRLWLEGYEGEKVVIAGEAQGWVLSGQPRISEGEAARQAASALRQLSEGQEVRPGASATPGMIALYVMAALFGAQLLFLIFSLLISLVTGGFG